MDAAPTDAPDLAGMLSEMTVADAQAAFARGVTAEALTQPSWPGSRPTTRATTR